MHILREASACTVSCSIGTNTHGNGFPTQRYAHNIISMATMTIRTTVSFDPATAARLDRLAKRWAVSKSETLRRVLEKAEREGSVEKPDHPDFTKMTPLQILDWLKANPQQPPGWGADFRRELREARDRDAEIEEQREKKKLKVQQPAETRTET